MTDLTTGLYEVRKSTTRLNEWEIQAKGPDGVVHHFGTTGSKIKAQAIADFANHARSYGTEFLSWIKHYQQE